MPVFSDQRLKEIGFSIFKSAGVPEDEAKIVSEALVRANLAGHDSHGVIRISQYVDMLLKEMIKPGMGIEILHETPTTAVIDGRWGFGQVVAAKAMEIAIAKARESYLGAVTARRSNHVGRIGDYAEMAAREGMIGMVTVNNHGAGLLVAPWGGRERRLSTNPISFAFPTGEGEPVVLDITTSIAAEGKVRVKRNRGERLPEGWIIDHEGKPSTNPDDLYGTKDQPPGALLPMGGQVGYKGFGLSVVVDVLSGALSGAGCSGTPGSRLGNSIFTLAINIEGFTSGEEFKSEVDRFIRFIKSCPLAPGFDEILMPGEIESRTHERRLREGIPVDDVTWNQILEAARRVGADI
jgi:uncharacterized oxidoreductase